MKKFLIAAVIFFMLTAQVEAVPFTREQIDKIFIDTEQNSEREDTLTLSLDVETFKEKFNSIITPILQETMGTDDVSAMEHLFLIKDYKVFSKPRNDIFANIFGDYRISLIGVSEPNGGKFKILSFYYTTPEEKDDTIFTILLLTAFVKSISPQTNVEDLMNELTAENSLGSAVKSGVKFSITSDGNLNTLTATSTQ